MFTAAKAFTLFKESPWIGNDHAAGIAELVIGFDHLRIPTIALRRVCCRIAGILPATRIHRRISVVRRTMVDDLIGIVFARGISEDIGRLACGMEVATGIKAHELALRGAGDQKHGGSNEW